MKSILITGAYGGMGQAVANYLAEKGFRVFALDQRTGESRKNVIPIQADITSEESLRTALTILQQHTDSLYAILHFAGIYMLDSLVEMDAAAFRRIIDVNLNGAFLINQVFFPLLHKGSRILIVTSELAPLDPLPFTGVYGLSKSALDKYAYSLRMELQLLGIQVSVLRAGAVKTDMLGVSTDHLERFYKNTRLYTCNARRFRTIVNRVEARCISPEKIAKKTAGILQKRHCAFVYNINRNPLLLLLNMLPKRIQLWAIRTVLKSE